MTPKLYKAGEVCELVKVQLYVLRSWEKEFPGIGIQKSPERPRLYRQSDLEHVQRIKQLVFGEGLTVSGARRRLDETTPAASAVSASEVAEVLDALSADARSRIALVRDGLREIHSLLSGKPGSSNGNRQRRAGVAVGPKKSALRRPPAKTARVKARPAAARSKTVKRRTVAKASAGRKKTTKRKRSRLRA